MHGSMKILSPATSLPFPIRCARYTATTPIFMVRSHLGELASLEGPFSVLFRKLEPGDKQSLSKVSRACRLACDRNTSCLRVDRPSVSWDRFPLLRLIRFDGIAQQRINDLPERIASLQIRGTYLSDGDVIYLASLKFLRTLDLQHCTVADIEQLSSLKGLRELNLNHLADIKGLGGLLLLTQLQSLHIGYSNVDRQLLHDLSSNLPQLLSLDVSYSRGITHTGARDTFRYNNSSGGLTQLILDGYSDMRSLAPLELLGSFRSFSMRDCGAQDPWLVSLSYLTGLTQLDLSSNLDLTDAGMTFVAERTTIEVLSIQDLPLLTESALSSLSALSRLQSLHTASSFAPSLPLAGLPLHLQRAIDAAGAEVPSLFSADISDDSN